MISKREIVNAYSKKCEEFNRPTNTSVYKYLEQQREQQEKNLQQRESAVDDEDMFFMDEDNNLDFIFMGNDKFNFSSRIDDLDLMPIASILEPHAIFIEHIDLRYNRITDTGAISISKVLRAAANLKTLNLQSNLIQEDGAESVAESLEGNDNLLYINLNGNKIRTAGMKKVVALLKSNPRIVELDIGDNEIDHDGIIDMTTTLN
jgi:Ran GTPase-activating protein (RanGAP) involved in mRNA processing and transport